MTEPAEPGVEIVARFAKGESPAVHILWAEFAPLEQGTRGHVVSLPDLVLKESDVYRARCISWLRELQQAGERSSGLSLIQRTLELDSLSSDLISTDYAFRTESLIYRLARYFALVDVLQALGGELEVEVSGDSDLGHALEEYANLHGHAWTILNDGLGKLDRAPVPIRRALVRGILRLLKGAAPNLLKRPRLSSHEFDLVFMDYFAQFDVDLFRRGVFSSAYWGTLPQGIEQLGLGSLWVHKYVPTAAYRNLPQARELLTAFRRSSGNERSTHVLLDDFLSFKVLARGVFALFLLVLFPAPLIRAVRVPSVLGEPDLTQFFARDLESAAPGFLASQIDFQARLSRLTGDTDADVYLVLTEGQAWETKAQQAVASHAGTQLWRYHNSTIRLWDMRCVPRTRESDGNTSLTVLDLVGGPGPRGNLLAMGVPESGVRTVEDLRNLEIKDPQPAKRGSHHSGSPIIIGVFPDYDGASASRLLEFVESAIETLPGPVRVIVKPHPAHPLSPELDQRSPLEVWHGNLADLFDECSAVVTGFGTSVSLQALARGIPTAVVCDPQQLPGVPVRNETHPLLCQHPSALGQFLAEVRCGEYELGHVRLGLDTDASLPQWSDLLSSVAFDSLR